MINGNLFNKLYSFWKTHFVRVSKDWIRSLICIISERYTQVVCRLSWFQNNIGISCRWRLKDEEFYQMQEAISGVKGGVCLEERREALQKNTLAKKKRSS